MCILSEGKITHSYQTAGWGKNNNSNQIPLKKPFTFSWVKAVQNTNFVGKRKLKKEKLLINMSISRKSLQNPAGFCLAFELRVLGI